MEYVIWGRSEFGTEEIDTAETMPDARYLLGEYRLAFEPLAKGSLAAPLFCGSVLGFVLVIYVTAPYYRSSYIGTVGNSETRTKGTDNVHHSRFRLH